jgi:hypothetical protein
MQTQITSFRKTHILNLQIAIALLMIPMIANAADRWMPIGSQNTPGGATAVNIGRITVNGYGNRIAIVRSGPKGYQMDMRMEFDCSRRRMRTLSSALTDKDGQLIGGGGVDKVWYDESKSFDISVVCKTPLPVESR